MTFDDLQEFVKRQPFSPFRIYLTDGTTFDVRHPELFMLGRRSVVVGVAAAPDQKYYDRSTMIDLLHVMRAELLQPAAQANGPPPGGPATS
jgi:hypothetical protein